MIKVFRVTAMLWIGSMGLAGLIACSTSTPAVQNKPVQAPFSIKPDEAAQFRSNDTLLQEKAPIRVVSDALSSETRLFAHNVKWRHETLYSIALWYTGVANNWKRLVAVNPNLAPKRIRIGDIIHIPEALLKTRQPMPKKFLTSVSGKKKQSPHQTPKPTTQARQLVLYGPIEQTAPLKDEDNSGLPVPLETID